MLPQTNITWAEWKAVESLNPGQWPAFMRSEMNGERPDWTDAPVLGDRYEVYLRSCSRYVG